MSADYWPLSELTQILASIEASDPHGAEQLLPLVYGELRKLAAQKMASEKPGQTLEPTALVHEAYLRLIGHDGGQHWDHRGHFFAAAAEAMRRILVENARSDTHTWRRILPPQGRKYCDDLSRFAADGRFVFIQGHEPDRFIDSVTEKTLMVSGKYRYWKDRGWIAGGDLPATSIQILRLPDQLEIPSDILELWAQVVVRGELDSEGRFKPWEEAIWEKHRQELASKAPLIPDFPFPGYVATDKLHWLRAEFHAASKESKPRLAKQLLDRAEAAGNKAAATWWQRWLQSNSEEGSTADGASDK